MDTDTPQKPVENIDVLRRLGDQFSSNRTAALSSELPELKRVEMKCRCLASVGQIMRTTCARSPSQQQIAAIIDEVFADSVCSIFLAAEGLDKPAQLVLRRVLELGLATFYLWEQPHIFWGWKEYDKDLTFTEITEFLSSESYLRFVASENDSTEPVPLFNVSLARIEYRALSNVVHGKISTFESSLADRFRHSHSDWTSHLSRVETIQDLLMSFACNRFSEVKKQLPIAQPQIIPHT